MIIELIKKIMSIFMANELNVPIIIPLPESESIFEFSRKLAKILSEFSQNFLISQRVKDYVALKGDKTTVIYAYYYSVGSFKEHAVLLRSFPFSFEIPNITYVDWETLRNKKTVFLSGHPSKILELRKKMLNVL